jgi:hypothetical protein
MEQNNLTRYDFTPNYVLLLDGCTYQIQTAAGRSTAPQVCKFGPMPDNEAAYMTAVVGLGDLLVRIQKADADPFNFSILVKSPNGDMLETDASNPKVKKLRERALGMLKRFGRYEVEGAAV